MNIQIEYRGRIFRQAQSVRPVNLQAFTRAKNGSMAEGSLGGKKLKW